MTNTLYLSYDGMTDPLGQSQVLPYLEGLSKEGYHIILLSCEKPDLYQKRKALIEERCKAANIDWRPIMFTRSPPILSTFWNFFKLKDKILAICQDEKISLIHCRSYISMYVVDSYIDKIPVIFDMRGFWADERVEGGNWNLKNPLYRFFHNRFKKLEKFWASSARQTISLTQAAKDEMNTNWGLQNSVHKPADIVVIPCCADADLFRLLPPSEEGRQKLGVTNNDYVVLYLGSVGTWYMASEMLDFFKRVLLKKPNAKFVWVTQDSTEVVLDLAKSRGVPAEAIRAYAAERKEIPVLLSVVDFSLFFIKPSYSKKASSPTKMGELLCAGVPIVCNGKVGDVEEIMSKMNAGEVVNEFTDAEYDRAITAILAGDYSNKEAIREKALQYFSLESGVAAYKKIYDTICGK